MWRWLSGLGGLWVVETSAAQPYLQGPSPSLGEDVSQSMIQVHMPDQVEVAALQERLHLREVPSERRHERFDAVFQPCAAIRWVSSPIRAV
eukprot:scaffold1466_cov385-Prasinococcus_capsulatus_cf.AAC.5